jgi:transcription antitermination factor NusG
LVSVSELNGIRGGLRDFKGGSLLNLSFYHATLHEDLKDEQADAGARQFPWYAIRTRSKHEAIATAALRGKGYTPYLPLYTARRRWSDRVVVLMQPLFPGYVFCRFNPRCRLPILTSFGVASIVGFGNEPAAVPDEEVEAIKGVLRCGSGVKPCPHLEEGQRVRLNRGALEGLEGVLLKRKNTLRMVVSIPLLQRSISVEVDRDWIDGIS